MKIYQKFIWKIIKKIKKIINNFYLLFFYFNKLINFIYFKVCVKLVKKLSTSFKDVQVSFFNDLKSSFFFGGFDGLGAGGNGGGGNGVSKRLYIKITLSKMVFLYNMYKNVKMW